MSYIGTFFLKLLSYLPFWALYGISDILYLMVYKVFGYRKKVVYENLKNSFPEKNEEEIKKIMDRFYENLCDIIVESIKMITISREELSRRNPHAQHKILDDLNAQGRTCFYFAGHLGNWEWSPDVAGIASKVPLWGVYTKIENKAMDEMVKFYRSRFGCEMIPMENIARRVLTDKTTKNICFIADQTPSNPEANIWVKFLNQETLAFSASAKLARKIDAAIIYASIIRMKRGYYDYRFEVLVENPKLLTEQEIMQTFFNRLEKDIRQYPDMWLWSHRRWKHKRIEN
jgi:KDO2-lipid IV(A) lauroyltransferase